MFRFFVGFAGLCALSGGMFVAPVFLAQAQDRIEVTNLPHQGALVVRAPGQLDAATIDAVAEIGAKQVASFPATSDVVDFIVSKCGKPSIAVRVHPRYRDNILAANRNLVDESLFVLAEERSLTLPACAPFALRQAEFEAPDGIQMLMQQLGIPFDLERFRQLANSQNFKAAAQSDFRRLQANPFPGGEACPSLDLAAFFACVNAIETAFLNRDRIKTADKIGGKIQVAVARIGGKEVRIAIAQDKADYVEALVTKFDLDKEKDSATAFKKANEIANIIPIIPNASVWGSTAVRPIAGVAAIEIAAPPPLRAPASSIPASFPLVRQEGEDQTTPTKAFAIENDIQFVTAVKSANKFDPACSNAHEKNAGRWPFDIGLFMRALSLNYAANSDMRKVENWSRTLVVDTGFDFTFDPGADAFTPEKHYFPRHQFAVNEREKSTSTQDTDRDTIPGNKGFAGVNLATSRRSSLTSIIDGDRRSHGLSVTALTLGGRDDRMRQLRALAALPVQVGTASLVPPGTSAPIVDKEYITNVLNYSKANHVFKVVNLSLSTRDKLSSFQSQLEQDTGRVFVVAAGNTLPKGVQVQEAVYPAALGGQPKRDREDQSVVITVGAHTGNGDIASFSNFGAQSVDLLAPGCMIPTYELKRVPGANGWATPPRAVEDHLNGTSLAAPVVSFLISVLMSDPSFSRPGVAKERAIVGTDFDFNLKDKVFSSGRLNPGKLLGYNFDILETPLPPGQDEKVETPSVGDEAARKFAEAHNRRIPFGRTRFGFLKNEESLNSMKLKCGLKEIEFRHVKKLSYDQASKAVLVISNTNPAIPRLMKQDLCEPKILDGVVYKFQDEETGEIEDLPANKVLDYVRRF